MHVFENVTSIMFCVPLPEYDRWDSDGKSLLSRSLVLFESVVNSRWFSRTSIILFLTGFKEFEVKLPKAPLETCFPAYTGGAGTKEAVEYITKQFLQTNRASLNMYPLTTDVFDTSNIRLMMVTVQETILANEMKDIGCL
ncbi:small G-protein GPA3 [Lactarius quietus]|nr:small G-protein GPA3 [Lactarius quietus]